MVDGVEEFSLALFPQEEKESILPLTNLDLHLSFFLCSSLYFCFFLKQKSGDEQLRTNFYINCDVTVFAKLSVHKHLTYSIIILINILYHNQSFYDEFANLVSSPP